MKEKWFEQINNIANDDSAIYRNYLKQQQYGDKMITTERLTFSKLHR